ncbi:hypothetical protein [Streptomyces sp. NPDC004528]|uniref:hypothetical protein n=1 Tax=Streptomyces sp. NPDC004528 TaxID=3154550 RepID=UPI0033B05196
MDDDQAAEFHETYPPTGTCPATAVDEHCRFHHWEPDGAGSAQCIDCHTPFEDFEFYMEAA